LLEHVIAGGPLEPQHLHGCARCRAALAELRAITEALATRPALAASDDAFVGAAVARTRPRTPWLAAAAAVLALGLGAGELVRRPDEPRARGTEHGPARAVAEVLYVRRGVAERVQGAALRGGDAFAVRAGNARDVPVYLLAFVVDAAGAVHWLYPAWTDPASDPSALPLAPHSPEQVLPELVAPEGAAPGPLRIYAVTLPRPVTVRAVEAHLAQLAPPGTGLFAAATIHRWSASWND